jgi:hypothetical protein
MGRQIHSPAGDAGSLAFFAQPVFMGMNKFNGMAGPIGPPSNPEPKNP